MCTSCNVDEHINAWTYGLDGKPTLKSKHRPARYENPVKSPTIPQSITQFTKAWKTQHQTFDQRLNYLKLIGLDQLKNVLRPDVSADIQGSIFETLEFGRCQGSIDPHLTLGILELLSGKSLGPMVF